MNEAAVPQAVVGFAIVGIFIWRHSLVNIALALRLAVGFDGPGIISCLPVALVIVVRQTR